MIVGATRCGAFEMRNFDQKSDPAPPAPSSGFFGTVEEGFG
jgi:hypothetical protein